MSIYLAISGSIWIYKSQIKYEETECTLLNITLFQCGYYPFLKNIDFRSYTSMLISVNETNTEIIMINYCMTCHMCQTLYNVNETHTCALVNNTYQLANYINGISNNNILIVGILSILISIFILSLLIVLTITYCRIYRRLGYIEL